MTKDVVSDTDSEIVEEMKAYEMAFKNEWECLKKHYQSKRHVLFRPLTPCESTVFHIAAYMGSVDMLRALFEMVPVHKKLEVLMMKNIHGNTLLHEAATSNNVDAAIFLVENAHGRGRVEMLVDRNNLGETPLYRAASFGDKATVEYLANEVEVEVEAGSLQDHFKRSHDNLSILHIAIMKEQFETAIWLLQKDPELANQETSDKKSCLHFLARMRTAFKSSSRRMYELQEIIYSYIPSNLQFRDESDKLVPNQSCKTTKKDHEPMAGLSTRESRFWMHLIRVEFIKHIVKMKKKHALAVELAKMLIRMMDSFSWLEHFNPESEEYNKIICVSRGMKNDKKKTGEAASKTGGGDSAVVVPPDTTLIVAVRTGIKEIVDEILDVYPPALQHVTRNGQNILHVAILHRQDDIFNRVRAEGEAVYRRLVLGIDNDGDTILHKAASIKYYLGGKASTVALKLQEELKRFDEVKDMVPPHYTIHRNNNGDTAEELFKKEHKDQLKDAQEWVKNTSQSCTAVAVLVATVVYAAAFTAPGGFVEEGHAVSELGHAVLEKRPLYSFFTVMDIAGLASSLTSLVIFLSVLTSSLDQHDFLRTIPRKLTLGFTLLFFAIGTTVLSFTASIILTVHLRRAWTKHLSYAVGFLPVGVYVVVQFSLYSEYLKSAVNNIWEFLKKPLPGI